MPPGDDELGERQRRSAESGIVASWGGRSAISVRAPCSSAGGSGEGGSKVEPTARRNTAEVGLGVARAMRRATRPHLGRRHRPSGSRARRRGTGGSITVSELKRGEPGCGEQGDHAAVGVAGEVVAGLEPRRNPRGVLLEIDALDRRPRREPGSLQHEESKASGERLLSAPRSWRRSSPSRERARAAPSDDRTKFEEKP